MDNIITNILGMEGKRRYRYFVSVLLVAFSLSPFLLAIALYLPVSFVELNPITLLMFILALTTPIVFLFLLTIYAFLRLTRSILDKNTFATLLSFLVTGLFGLMILCVAYLNNWSLEHLIKQALCVVCITAVILTILEVLNLCGITIPPRK